MQIINAKVENFGSYESLEFDFKDQGLCLVAGPTGSGKSTLCDLTPWILFGSTAKDGGVDEVRSWGSDSPTKGSIQIQIEDRIIQIHRTRGKNSNDLYFENNTSDKVRGKDLNDTQKMINNLLGFDLETYLAGSYFHEFSKTAQFFNTTAKNRRLISTQIVDLSSIISIQNKSSDLLKRTKSELTQSQHNLEINSIYLDNAEKNILFKKKHMDSFEERRTSRLLDLYRKSELFEENKKKEIIQLKKSIPSQEVIETMVKELEELRAKIKSDICKECGAHLDNSLRLELKDRETKLQYLVYESKNIKSMLQKVMNNVNPYDQEFAEVEAETDDSADIIKELTTTKKKLDNLVEMYILEVEKLTEKVTDLELLQEVMETYRASQISSTIKFLEDNTNHLLSTYFDAEIKVLFSADSADKIDVVVYKDANECSYTQLSKGQRQLLKLCFGISVMKAVSNKSGIKFNTLFLDEALDGFDDVLKVKTFTLLQTLALDYESVFVVEHNNDLKTMFQNKYTVTLVNGKSVINEKD
jgi:DNA repair exonuclease SbcCD ATPase subunit